MVSIKGLPKHEVLAALYNKAKVIGLGAYSAKSGELTEQEAKEQIQSNPFLYFDYVFGRVMKVDLKTDELDTYLYNRDNGYNMAEYVIKELRDKKEKQ